MQSYIISLQIPHYVIDILKILEIHGFEAYVVGGCVRDSLLGLLPKDWDITSNAEPMQIQQIFDLYNEFFEVIPVGLKYGTLGIKDRKTKNLVEVTTYRTDGVYKDGRRPETIQFAKTLQEDISRRDFTINTLVCKILHKRMSIKEYPMFMTPLQQNSIHLHSIPCVKDVESRFLPSCFLVPTAQPNTKKSKLHKIICHTLQPPAKKQNLEDTLNTTGYHAERKEISMNLGAIHLHTVCSYIDSVEKLDSVSLKTHVKYKRQDEKDSMCSLCFMQLFDYHNGVQHLQQRNIVCVGNANERFLEDALRIMRAIRFASVLPFAFSLQDSTKEAVQTLTTKLQHIANERIQMEFAKLLCGQYAYSVLPIYQGTILFIFPLLESLGQIQLQHNYKMLKIAPKNLILRLAILSCPIPYAKDICCDIQSYVQQYNSICKNLHFDNKTIQSSQTLLQLLGDTEIFITQKSKIALKHLLLEYDTQIISQLIHIYIILQKVHEQNCVESSIKDSILRYPPFYNTEVIHNLTQNFNTIIINNECHKLSQLNINGSALQDIAKSMGISLQGKQIGILLRQLLYAVIEEEVVNTFHALENKARFYIEKLL